MNSVGFQGKPFNITVIQAYAATSNAEEAEVEQFYEDLQDFLVDHDGYSISSKGFLPAVVDMVVPNRKRGSSRLYVVTLLI